MEARPKIDLENKVVLITGAARGIGLAATQALLKNGARVSMTDIDEERGLAACTELQKEYSIKNVMFTRCDVAKLDQLKSVFARTKEEFGGIDIVCNNAGIRNEKEWRKMMEINLCATIEGTYLALEYMSTKSGGKGGIVINVASLAGLGPMNISPVYCATKHGVVGFTRSLKECSTSDGVRINVLCPDFVDTKMVRDNLDSYGEEFKAFVLSKLISTDKVAEGILYLIADTSKSGAALTVNKEKGLTYVYK